MSRAIIHLNIILGAQGGAFDGYFGGKGASMQGDFSLYAGETLSILVGRMPYQIAATFPAGGGGQNL